MAAKHSSKSPAARIMNGICGYHEELSSLDYTRPILDYLICFKLFGTEEFCFSALTNVVYCNEIIACRTLNDCQREWVHFTVAIYQAVEDRPTTVVS